MLGENSIILTKKKCAVIDEQIKNSKKVLETYLFIKSQSSINYTTDPPH